jgi:hypothetical protein
LGEYDSTNGIESPRIKVTLATGIPAERCERINLSHKNPDEVNLDEFSGREDEGIAVIPKAGEMLYRIKPAA